MSGYSSNVKMHGVPQAQQVYGYAQSSMASAKAHVASFTPSQQVPQSSPVQQQRSAPQSKCNDAFFAALFLGHFLLISYLALAKVSDELSQL